MEELSVLALADSIWRKNEKGKVHEIKDKQDNYLVILFSVDYYQVIVNITVGPRKGLRESITVLDTRPVKVEVDRLVFSVYLNPHLTNPSSLIGSKLSKEDRALPREKLVEKISQLLIEQCAEAAKDPEKYKKQIDFTFYKSERSTGAEYKSPFFSGGVPRT